MNVEGDFEGEIRNGGDVIAQSREREAMESEIRSLCLLIFLFFLCLYLLTFKGICTGDNLLHYDLVVNAVSTGQPTLPDDRYDLDKQRYLKPFVSEGLDGELYVTLPPGLAVASIPFGALGVAIEKIVKAPESADEVPARRNFAEVRAKPSAFFTGLINPLVSALLIAVFFWMASGIADSVEWAAVLSLMLGLSTIIWPYSSTYWTQPLATAAIFSSFVLLVQGVEADRLLMAALSGLLAGFGFLTRYELLFVLPWLILFVLCSRFPSVRRRGEFLLGVVGSFLIAAMLLMAWNHYRFGSILDTGAFHQQRFGASFRADLALSLPANLVSLSNSIFVYSPPLVLFFFGIRALFVRYRAMSVATVGIVATGLVLYSRFTSWDASGSWGPRFLVVLTPFMLLPAVMFRPHNPWRRALVCCLLVIGFGVQLVPAIVPYQHAAVARHFAEQPSPQRYFTSTEIVPHLQALTAGGIELWWLRTPLLGVVGVCIILFQVYLGRRLVQKLSSS